MNKPCLLILAIFMIGTVVPFRVYAQKVLSCSEPQRPAWLANKTPEPTNATFYYQIAEGQHAHLDEAKASSLINLSTYIKRTNNIDARTDARIEVNNSHAGNSETESYQFTYTVQGEELNFTSHKMDEYWEYITYPDGERKYLCYTLFAVANQVGKSNFDRLTFSRKYGARGFVRSLIVPGWGQMYKGSAVKGGCILGGEVLLIGGIIVAENLRSSYIKKMRENPKHLQTYNTKADNWSNIRNVCIGGAAALYVYNLIDALVANGRKRSMTQKPHFALSPTTDSDCNGISLAFKF